MRLDQIEVMEKIANQLLDGDSVGQDHAPIPNEDDVAAAQAENAMLAEELAAAKAEEAKMDDVELGIQQALDEEGAPEESGLSPEEEAMLAEEQLASAVTDELVKHANDMYELGTITKIVECARGINGEEMQKSAYEILSYMTADPDNYYPALDKVANELFATEEAAESLFTLDALFFIEEQLAFLEDDSFEKIADETGGLFMNLKAMAGTAISNTKEKVMDAAKSVVELNQIKGQISQAQTELEASSQALAGGTVPDDQIQGMLDQRRQLTDNLDVLHQRQRLGRGVAGGIGGVAAAGAAYGGHKLYEHFQQPNPTELLLQEKVSGTLMEEYEKNGGISKMSKTIVHDFLKVAGAAGLVGLVNNENADFELRKEASEVFDHASRLSHEEMGEVFTKVAFNLFPEQELHEIVAGMHTESLLDKVAFFLDANTASLDELEKVANAGGVAAVKNVGAGLADAASNLENTIATEKANTEGAGREYIGEVTGGGTGKAGGGLVGGTEGYNVTNNPGKYDVEQTASALEEAYLAKQAAAQAYVHADEFIRSILSN